MQELSQELGRPVRPLMWGDEFYMYGPGRDWVGIERIPKSVVMGYWKYWPDYAGIGGLLERGYDVLGISAMYNHCFYLADLSPEDPPKSWPSMEQTGVRNITEMVRDADAARQAHPEREFLGVATASFSKHRLRAFDSIWYGFVLNGQCTWSQPQRPLTAYQRDFTRAFVRHWFDVRAERHADTVTLWVHEKFTSARLYTPESAPTDVRVHCVDHRPQDGAATGLAARYRLGRRWRTPQRSRNSESQRRLKGSPRLRSSSSRREKWPSTSWKAATISARCRS